MKKIKILYLVEDFRIGGLERIVETLYDGLSSRRFEIKIWCLSGGGELAEKFISQKKDIKILNLKSYHNPLNIIRLARLINVEKFQIIHTHGYYASVFGRICGFFTRCPFLISHVHTTYRNLQKRNFLIERMLSIITNKIICCSDAANEYLLSKGKVNPEKTVTIYNGVKDYKCCNDLQRENNCESDIVRIVMIASLVSNKGHQVLFDATKKVEACSKKNIRLVIVGEGPLKSDLTKYSKITGIDDKVDFIGVSENIGNILKNADICVLPTVEREGLGVSLIEAMSFGLPVIGTNVGGIPEVVDDGINGFLVPPMDSDTLADKLKDLIGNKEIRINMGREGRKKYEKKFRSDHMVRRVGDLYESLIKKNHTVRNRILYLHNKVEIGGGEKSLLNLWENLDKYSCDLHLMIPIKGLLSYQAKKLGLSVNTCEIPKLEIKNMPKIIGSLYKIGKYCIHRNINVIHSYSPRYNILGGFIGRLLRIPVIWHERNMIFGMEKDISSKFICLPDSIICNSMAIAERFRTKKGIPSKISVIMNGVDTAKFCPGEVSPALSQKYNLNGKKVVGLISNYSARKNPEYFLDACPLILKQVPDTTFIVVGDEFTKEDRGRRDELLRKVKSLNIEDQVIFTGFVSDVSEIIKAFDLGVAVTEKEACSRAILEIMASGKPVVAFNTGGNPELIEHDITGTLLNFGDTEGLAKSIVELLDNEKKRKKMGLCAANRIRQFFDVRLNAERTTELYLHLLKDNVKKLS